MNLNMKCKATALVAECLANQYNVRYIILLLNELCDIQKHSQKADYEIHTFAVQLMDNPEADAEKYALKENSRIF